jgi:hypothetical protein
VAVRLQINRIRLLIIALQGDGKIVLDDFKMATELNIPQLL